jgi:hypothetical protein
LHGPPHAHPAFSKQRQEDLKFKASLGYIARHCVKKKKKIYIYIYI